MSNDLIVRRYEDLFFKDQELLEKVHGVLKNSP
jgi:hypothetical protein